jgi:aspartate/methionine/tyrosine aminotransferase
VASLDYLSGLLDLAETHDFRVFADECYSEIYRSDPPPSLLQAVQTRDPERALAFHSLSKRSSLAGLRSGFVAAGPKTMPHLRQLRAYAGAPLPLPLQRAAQKLWADETHVATSRAEYVAKYDIANRVFHDVPGCHAPEAGFFLWLPVEDGEAATLKLWRDIGVKVLPGAYLAREVDGANPGDGYIRVAMVTKDKAVFEAGLTALRDALYG